MMTENEIKRKEENHNFIRKFSKITIDGICKKVGVARQNVFLGTARADKIEKVKKEIEKEIAKLYLEE